MGTWLYDKNGNAVEFKDEVVHNRLNQGWSTSPPSSGGSSSSSPPKTVTSGTSIIVNPAAGTQTVTNNQGVSTTSPYVSAAATAQQQRAAHVATLIFSDVPQIAAIQRMAADEYIATGIWQQKYTDQADAIRKSLNPMYTGGGLGFNEKQFIIGDGSSGSAFGDWLAGLFGGGKAAGETVMSPANNSTFAFVAIGAILLLLMRGR